ncbi:MAG: hypothetical protein ACRC7V_01650, partial [Lachnospiraceae bacterium]
TMEFYVPNLIQKPVIDKAELIDSLGNQIADLKYDDNQEFDTTVLEESQFDFIWKTQDYAFATQKIQLIYVNEEDGTTETVLYEDSSTPVNGTTQTRNFDMTNLGNSDGSNTDAWKAYAGKQLVLRITQVIYYSDTNSIEISDSSDDQIYIPKIQEVKE